MPIKTVGPQRLYEKIVEHIRHLIRRGEFQPGDRLPAARDLAAQLGVSRPVVREAMIALELAGLVEIRTGAGIFVKYSEANAATLSDIGQSPEDIIMARKVLESEIAFMAAERSTPSDLAAIYETIEQMKEAIKKDKDIEEFDRSFHFRIAAATQNAVLKAVADQLWELMLTPLFTSLHSHAGLPSASDATLKEHEAILRALMSRNGKFARRAMWKHLSRVEAMILTGNVTVG